ncbi:hypothetical protein RUM44_011935 [Polyplax serrata]|uniref:Uncharacterized protein n=1 Tax=Polyplax serrata TaxID=468196 RepID=A0ABR1BBS7_POLSC
MNDDNEIQLIRCQKINKALKTILVLRLYLINTDMKKFVTTRTRKYKIKIKEKRSNYEWEILLDMVLRGSMKWRKTIRKLKTEMKLTQVQDKLYDGFNLSRTPEGGNGHQTQKARRNVPILGTEGCDKAVGKLNEKQ